MGESKRRKIAGDYPAQTPKPARAPAETVSWEVVGDLAEHPKSADVLEALEEVRKDYPGTGGRPMVVVLESGAGAPIIRAQTLGLGAFMALIDRLQELDLDDRLESRSGPERGVDAAFR